jgi:hypothetical protein
MDMVRQLGVSLGKRPDAGGTSATSTPMPPPPQGTPPHYQPNLSPIPEGSTPGSSATLALAPQFVRPLHFGNLSPRHLSNSEISCPNPFS